MDCDKYRARFTEVSYLLKDMNEEARMKALGVAAVATNVPIIVVACYSGELYGFTPILDDFIERMMKFYCVKEVINARRD